MANSANVEFDKMLIEAVKVRPFLFDENANEYYDDQKKKCGWADVANITKHTARECMTRWKSLKNDYSKQKTRARRNSALYRNLSFLNKDVSPSRSKKSHSDSISILDITDSSSESTDDSSLTFTTDSSIRRVHRKQTPKLPDEDEDHAFCQALMPYIKQMTREGKLEFKVEAWNKIFQIISNSGTLKSAEEHEKTLSNVQQCLAQAQQDFSEVA